MNIAIVTAPTPYPWSPLHLDALSAGDEATVELARALATRGHVVTVYYDGASCEGPGGVTYQPRALLQPGADVAIFHVTPPVPGLGRVTVYWTYEEHRIVDAAAADHVVAPSPYAARCLAALLPSAAARVTVIPYGVDAMPGRDGAHDPDLILHASSPERGLATLLAVWPEVQAARPTARLVCSYGWDHYLARGGDPGLQAQIEAAIAHLPNVTLRRYTRGEMAALYAEAGIWAYYCTGGEAFCVSGVKAQAAGCVPVVHPWGGLHDTVRGGLTATSPETFRDALIRALDPAVQAELRAALPEDVAMSWDAVAAQWEALLDAPVPARSSVLAQVPQTPPALVGDIATANALPMLHQIVTGWLQSVGAQHPAIDPELGLAAPTLTRGPDAVVVGWRLEDAPTPPRETLQSLALPKGTPVLCLTSTGPWRAGRRRRHLLRRDLVEIFGQQPEVTLRCVGLGEHGSGIFCTAFRYDADALGTRNLRRVRRVQSPRETVSVCMIVRDVESTIRKALCSVVPIADEVILIDTGSVDGTAAVVRRFAAEHPTLPVHYVPGTSPRYCYDCQREHAVGEMAPGHRVAGFETPRNESLLRATGAWCLWLDGDETLLHGERLAKYLRPSPFAGYSIAQDHHASDPPQAYKRDLPVRLFRRIADPDDTPGLQEDGPHRWPTVHTGTTARFCGIVHEHPGLKPGHYQEGIGPVMVLGDVWIAHTGYYTEAMRRGRFVRNWPLMVADRQKYPDRRLGQFLWLRDLSHHARYLREQHGGQVTPEVVALCEEGIALYRRTFLDTNDMLTPEALGYATALMEMLGRGVEVQVTMTARKPEVSGDERAEATIAGRVESPDDLVRLLTPRFGEIERWRGDYV